MIKFENFIESDFEKLKSWINNEEELYQFAGNTFMYPLTNKQLETYIKTPKIEPLKVILTKTDEIIGHCELNCQNEIPRLSRIIIGKRNLRGKRIGEKIVPKMVGLLFEHNNTTEVDLSVFEWNKKAIKCYENVGFSINKKKQIQS